MGLANVSSNVALALDKVSAADIATLKRMGNRTSEDNPIRVHHAKGDGFIIAVGKFSVDEAPAGPRYGLSAELIDVMTKAAENGAFYLELSKDGPAVPTTKPHADLSTGHLRHNDYHLLQDVSDDLNPAPIHAYDHSYGWIVDVKSAGPEADLKAAGFSDEFLALVAAARESGADLLDFDQDADLDPGFPEFDAATGELVKPEEDTPSAPGM
ncbi:hypothetical protein [Mesorhizobium sp. SP-1A]|uniref:DUF5983 family protein n=1 Tax=Mesorhizobium sp. SP-1A TaxID=3077840 RepID=UPI0028F6DD5C|nr:hypothetical protein [Mesorhizobium sp. SP-1A]